MIEQLEHHFILFSIIFLLLGYILGKNLKNYQDQHPLNDNFEKQKRSIRQNRIKQDKVEKLPTINIDETTHVVKIKTDHLEKKYEEIGDKKSTDENINSSIHKLKNLRGEK